MTILGYITAIAAGTLTAVGLIAWSLQYNQRKGEEVKAMVEAFRRRYER